MYSLLIGIHDKTSVPKYVPSSRGSELSESQSNLGNVNNFEDTPFYERDEGGIENYGCDRIYFMGIIDILTEYNTKKKLEHFFKSLKYGDKISCIPPDKYGHRFSEFINSRILSAEQYDSMPVEEKPEPVDPFHSEVGFGDFGSSKR